MISQAVALTGSGKYLESIGRRGFMVRGSAAGACLILPLFPHEAQASTRVEPTRSRIDKYDAPRPEVEGPGLVVLRVAEVCAFQEKLLRAFAAGKDDEFEGFAINAVQIAFGTRVLLKNSNLDGNLKLIARNARKDERDSAVFASVSALNTIGKIYDMATNSPAELSPSDMLVYADLYNRAQGALMSAFSTLPLSEQEKYYGYARELKAYEEEVAKGDAIEY